MPSAPGGPPPRLLRWGLPRDPYATEHVTGFVVTTVLTILVTRGFLELAGFPQIGGGGLHVAHVLWGGLLMGVAVILALSFAGPVIRPLVAFLGGIGFGLFIDEVGKFLTQDNDYFYAPAPTVMYVTLVLVMIGADVLHGRRAHHPAEYLAAAADHAVAGLVGGLSERRRAVARELLDRGRDAPGGAETAALVAAISDDDEEVLDPLDMARQRLRNLLGTVVTRRWATRATTVLLVALIAGAPATLAAHLAEGQAPPGWAGAGVLAATALTLLAAGRGWLLLRRDRYLAFRWLRGAALITLLLTLVALYRLEPWLASAGLAVAVAALGVTGAELRRLERLRQAPA
ncbi:hypothetical protein FE374_07820 [Georgenia yuyongxinii]|uniref:Uncharacterized protein n=1 Tax=Georgenia yuyongxinii TaxID=2589797 RepID=A0A5B8C1S1_9MICO|nr:hypothetical protein [Georgenia yuyongxinii]QDC24543.1 hypothetical protein FE374_07820 [Georgenia yuyongxinii]